MSVRLDLPHGLAGHCGSGALRDLAAFHGQSWSDQPLSEGMAFGIGGALSFLYLELPELSPPVYLVGRSADLESNFCEHMDIELDLRHADDATEGWSMLKAELDSGRPTMVWADIAELDYLRVRMSNTRHDIVVCGYDEDGEIAFVADNDREEIQECSLESLGRARMSEGFPGPNRNGTFVMRWPRSLPEPEVAARRAIASTVTTMTEGSAPLLGVDAPSGLASVDRFVERYPAWRETFGEDLVGALRGLRVFIVKAGTGGAMFRGLQATFLSEMGELLDDEALRDAGALYARLASTWVALAGHLTGFSEGRDPAKAHAAGLGAVERIGVLEHEGVRLLDHWCR